MKFDREILEMLPCVGNVVAQFEKEDGDIDLVPVECFARCITYFDWGKDDDDCVGCTNCSCCCDDDEEEREELVIPMVVMNDEMYLTFADEYDNYIGLKRI